MKTLIIHVDENEKDYILLIGQSQRENDQIIKQSEQNDLWFHLDKFSGPHMILQNRGEPIPKRYLNKIATFFAEYKNNLPNRYSVIYTELKNISLTKTLGQVVTKNVNRISV